MSSQQKGNKNRRVQVREIGQSGNYWYAAELSKNLKVKQSLEVIFWNSPIALYRGEDGIVRGLENRCAHRQLRLTSGIVDGDGLICQYHGWTYDACGKCVSISHEIGVSKKNKLPDIQIKSYPAQEKYGLIWIFPGDPELANSTPLPSIPQLDGKKKWACVPIDVTINAHFSMILENVCDFNHAFLHRKYRPFTDPSLIDYYRKDDVITMEYKTDLSNSQVVKLAGKNQGKDLDKMTLWYNYPYQASNTGDTYLHWLYMLPMDKGKTRCFFMFLFEDFEIPFIRLSLPRFTHNSIIKLVNKFYIIPLLSEDLWALEEEMLGHERHPEQHHYEFNPIVSAFQKLSLEKWNQYTQSELERALEVKKKKQRYFVGGGLTADNLANVKESEPISDKVTA